MSFLITLPAVEAALGGYRHRPVPEGQTTRWASVAAVLRDRASGPEVLLIRRSENPKDPWSGHMAMPGGRVDPGDASVQHAAERETCEEVGIDLTAKGRLLGRLDDVGAVASGRRLGLTVAPFVYALNDDLEVDWWDQTEVQEVHWVSLNDLAGPAFRAIKTYDWAGTKLMLPAWRYNERVIWGLTYNMLDSLIRIVQARP